MRGTFCIAAVLASASLLPAQIIHNPFGQSPQAPLKSASKTAESAVKGDPARDLVPYVKQFVDVLSLVKSESSDPQEANKMIYEGAIPSMLRQLDPHTQFFDPGQFQQLKQMQDSEQKGFGSVVSVLPGQVIFLQTLPGTPSNKAGIQAGDSLVAVNNIGIQSLDPQQIMELLTEARQQKITVYIRRQGYQRIFQFSLTPELVDSPSVEQAFLLKPGIGYIKVTSWDLKTAKELKDAIEKMDQPSKLQGLVLDLRGNPGGIVKAALDAAAMFLEPGQRILTAKGRTSEVDSADVPPNAKPYHFKLSVLVNERTASASEILSGALQDHDRAVIVGLPSYGKGLVQSVISLADETGLAITTAFYYTPSGRSIQKPLRNSALTETFAAKVTQLPTYKTDKGRTVTGGGGIQPDIIVYPEVPTRLETVLDASGSFTAYATQYLSQHSPLAANFQVTPDVLDDFKVYLAARTIQPSIAEWSSDRKWITSRLTEEIVTQGLGVSKGDEIQMQRDVQVQAAMKAMQDGFLLASAVR